MDAEGPIGVFPGSFDPLTIAHLAIAEAAVTQLGLARLDLAISRDALGKSHLDDESVTRRLREVQGARESRPWLAAVVVQTRLVVDIAEGYDAVVMGADKWDQVNDPVWYSGDHAARDAAIDALPRVMVAPRGGIEVPAHMRLHIPAGLDDVSSTAVRQGRTDWAASGQD